MVATKFKRLDAKEYQALNNKEQENYKNALFTHLLVTGSLLFTKIPFVNKGINVRTRSILDWDEAQRHNQAILKERE